MPTQVSICGISAHASRAGTRPRISGSELVRLTVVANELEAEMVRALLTTEGIESMQRYTDFAAGAADAGPTAGGPREILVHAGDLEAARELLAAE